MFQFCPFVIVTNIVIENQHVQNLVKQKKATFSKKSRLQLELFNKTWKAKQDYVHDAYFILLSLKQHFLHSRQMFYIIRLNYNHCNVW